jgi:hypothetical protein
MVSEIKVCTDQHLRIKDFFLGRFPKCFCHAIGESLHQFSTPPTKPRFRRLQFSASAMGGNYEDFQQRKNL